MQDLQKFESPIKSSKNILKNNIPLNKHKVNQVHALDKKASFSNLLRQLKSKPELCSTDISENQQDHNSVKSTPNNKYHTTDSKKLNHLIGKQIKKVKPETTSTPLLNKQKSYNPQNKKGQSNNIERQINATFLTSTKNLKRQLRVSNHYSSFTDMTINYNRCKSVSGISKKTVNPQIKTDNITHNLNEQKLTKCKSFASKDMKTQNLSQGNIISHQDNNIADDQAMKDAQLIPSKKKVGLNKSASDVINQKSIDIKVKPLSKKFSQDQIQSSKCNDIVKPKEVKSDFEKLINKKSLSKNTQSKDLMSDLLTSTKKKQFLTDENKNQHAMIELNQKKNDLKDNLKIQLATSIYRNNQANKDKKPFIKPGRRLFTDSHASPAKVFF